MTSVETSASRYTAEQQTALSALEHAVALEAGAGCGKTFVLTERLLAHLQPASDAALPAVDEVVAITFTDAAAREMRDRVRRKCLDRLATAEEAARPAWLRLLRSLDSARVSTIHAFCGTLLRNHAVELGLDPAFAVLDQPTADVMLSEAIDDHLRAGLEKQSEAVLRLAAEFDLIGLKQRLRVMLDSRANERAAWIERRPEQVVDAWRRAYERLSAEAFKELCNSPAWDELLQLLLQAQEPTKGFQPKREWLLERVPKLQSGKVDAETLELFAENLKLHGSYKKSWQDADDYERYKAVVETVRKQLSEPPDLAEGGDLHAAADLGLMLLREADGVAVAYAEVKRQARALDYDDLLREAHRLLTAPEHADVQQELRRGVRLLLVDEFQDTDHLQAEVVRSLVGLGSEANDPGRLFFVGDFKQSIYRFRGAEPAVFRDLQEETPLGGRLPLSKNFRSQPAVLDFVNHVFGTPFGERYTALTAHREQVTPEPAAELLVTNVPDPQANVEQKRKSEARAIARRLRELLDAQTSIVADEDGKSARPIQPGDIAILFQSLSDVHHYEQALREQDIEYYLVGGHAFYSQQEVYDILHLLRAIASGCDEVSLAGVLRSPMFALEDETLYWMVRTAGSLNAAIASQRAIRNVSATEAVKLTRARDVLTELRALKGCVATVELLQLAMERTAYDATLLADFLGERKRANLEKLFEQARASDAASPNGIGDVDRFVRQLSEFTLQQPKEALASTSSEGADVVRLMTVHRAKGLEFPVVVVPDMGRESQSDRRTAAFDTQLGPLVKPTDSKPKVLYGLDIRKRLDVPEDRAESLRKFYVACTRAADYLILSAVMEWPVKPNREWLTILNDRFDLETGEPREPAADQVQPLSIITGDPSPVNATSGGRRADRRRLVEAARQELGQGKSTPSPVDPIAVRPESLRQFSVSRLTGRLHQGRERPESLALQATLRSERTEIDPLGLGTLVHAVLERLPKQPMAPPEGLVDSLCSELAPLHLRRQIDQAADEAAEMLHRFVATSAWESLVEAERFEREVEFLLTWPPEGDSVSEPANDPACEPDAWLRGYIDALVKTPAEAPDGGWWVVDFKTNHVDTAGVQELAEHYRLQLGVYALAAERSLAAPPVGMRLCFLRPGMSVEFAWDASERESTIRRVNEAIQRVRAESTP